MTQQQRLVRLLPVAALAAALGGAGCGDITVAGGGGGGGDTRDAGADVVVGDPTCARYCEAIQAGCGDDGATAQYASQAQCEAYCEIWAALPIGATGDTSGDSIGCRTWHSGAAAADPGSHCPHAGPTGGGVCGSLCESYCRLAALNCTGEEAIYATEDACFQACAGFPTDGQAGDLTGDTVQCRITEAGLAGSERPVSAAQHCPLAASESSVCAGTVEPGPPATYESYCQTVFDYCGGADATHATPTAQYSTAADCMAYSAATRMELGTTADRDVNTAGCRQHYAELGATPQAATGCQYAGKTGGGMCGSWCDNYCDLALVVCDDLEPPLFSSYAACETACAGLSADGPPPPPLAVFADEPTDDSVQCRLFYLQQAATSPTAAAQYCPSAAAYGSDRCQW